MKTPLKKQGAHRLSESDRIYKRLSEADKTEVLGEAKRALDFQRLQSDHTPEEDVAAGKRKPN